jgi:hypothetical protein
VDKIPEIKLFKDWASENVKHKWEYIYYSSPVFVDLDATMEIDLFDRHYMVFENITDALCFKLALVGELVYQN